MMRAMQKKMVEMIKSGEGLDGIAGMEGMHNMLDGMAGKEGMEHMDLSPQQVKEMLLALKGMKESGSFSREDLDMIKKQFKEAFGTSIDELGPSKPLTEDEKEILGMMKTILDD